MSLNLFRRLKMHQTLAFKLTLAVSIFLVLSVIVFGVINTRIRQSRSIEFMTQSAGWLAAMLTESALPSLLNNRRIDLGQKLKAAGLDSGIEFIQFITMKGRIVSSLNREHLGQRIDVSSKACIGCHDQAKPLLALPKSKRSFIQTVSKPKPHRVLFVIHPVYAGKKGAGSASAKGKGPLVLGVIKVGVSLKTVDAQNRAITWRMTGLAVLIFIFIAVVLALCTAFFVKRPLSSLLTATRHIAKGDYDQKVRPSSHDEIGSLAESLEMMRASIKEKTEDLDQNRRQFQTLFEQVPCYISVQDESFKLVAVNKMFENDFGSKLGDYCYAAYKGRQTRCPGCTVAKVFADGQVHSGEETVVGKNEEPMHFLIMAAPIMDKDGRITSVMEMSADVTALRRLEESLRRSEEKYRLFFNSDPHPICVFEQSTYRILDANDRALSKYQYSKEDLLGRSFLELTNESDRERVREFFKKGLSLLPQAQQLRGDGSKFYASIHASYGEYQGGQAVIAAVTDITERLQTEQLLLQASKMATLGEMSTGVAHELNQPLSIIGIGSNFLRKTLAKGKGLDSAQAGDVLDDIIAQVERADQIIRHLREFGRKHEVKKSKVNLNHPIEGVFRLLGQQLKLRGIKVETDLDSDLPLIWADDNRLEQVFINLVINARDAIEERRAQDAKAPDAVIKLKTFTQGDRVAATVTDNGCGISQKVWERLFEPFFSTKNVGKGTGLGLSISYGIVTDYQGTIDVDSQVGQGAVFKLSFPQAREDGP